jgi:hypothetical protein
MDTDEGWQSPSRCSNPSGCARVKVEGEVVLIRATWNPFDKVILTHTEWDDLKEAIKSGEYDEVPSSA